jgi:hypothetical protein
MVSSEEYTDLALRCREVKSRATDSFARHQLETLERSYRGLTESAAVLESSVLKQKLAQLE